MAEKRMTDAQDELAAKLAIGCGCMVGAAVLAVFAVIFVAVLGVL